MVRVHLERDVAAVDAATLGSYLEVEIPPYDAAQARRATGPPTVLRR
jgi:hypothetical protein